MPAPTVFCAPASRQAHRHPRCRVRHRTRCADRALTPPIQRVGCRARPRCVSSAALPPRESCCRAPLHRAAERPLAAGHRSGSRPRRVAQVVTRPSSVIDRVGALARPLVHRRRRRRHRACRCPAPPCHARRLPAPPFERVVARAARAQHCSTLPPTPVSDVVERCRAGQVARSPISDVHDWPGAQVIWRRPRTARLTGHCPTPPLPHSVAMSLPAPPVHACRCRRPPVEHVVAGCRPISALLRCRRRSACRSTCPSRSRLVRNRVSACRRLGQPHGVPRAGRAGSTVYGRPPTPPVVRGVGCRRRRRSARRCPPARQACRCRASPRGDACWPRRWPCAGRQLPTPVSVSVLDIGRKLIGRKYGRTAPCRCPSPRFSTHHVAGDARQGRRRCRCRPPSCRRRTAVQHVVVGGAGHAVGRSRDHVQPRRWHSPLCR